MHGRSKVRIVNEADVQARKFLVRGARVSQRLLIADRVPNELGKREKEKSPLREGDVPRRSPSTSSATTQAVAKPETTTAVDTTAGLRPVTGS